MSAIRYEVRDNVAEILLDNPPVNALDRGLMDDLLATLERAGRDDEVGAIIIASAVPGRFCAGLDLGTYLKSSPADAREIVDALYARLCDIQFNLGKPSIAAISGAALDRPDAGNSMVRLQQPSSDTARPLSGTLRTLQPGGRCVITPYP